MAAKIPEENKCYQHPCNDETCNGFGSIRKPFPLGAGEIDTICLRYKSKRELEYYDNKMRNNRRRES